MEPFVFPHAIYDLSCRLVLINNLEALPPEKRSGILIVDEKDKHIGKFIHNENFRCEASKQSDWDGWYLHI
jgi:hypothetical protein